MQHAPSALSPLGKAMAEHMAWTWWRSPHVSTIIEVDMSAVAAARKAWTPGGGPKPSYTAVVANVADLGENERFKFAIEAPVLCVLAVSAAGAWTRRRGADADEQPAYPGDVRTGESP